MPIIQEFPDELDYVNAKLHPLSPASGSYLLWLCYTALASDANNYPLIQPAIRSAMVKYPADPDRLAAERRDR